MLTCSKHYVISHYHYCINSIFPGLLFHPCCLSLDTTVVRLQVCHFLFFCLFTFHPFFRNIYLFKIGRKNSKLFNKSSPPGRKKSLSHFPSIGVSRVFLWAANSFWNCKKSCGKLWSCIRMVFDASNLHAESHLFKNTKPSVGENNHFFNSVSVQNFLQQEWKASLEGGSDKKQKIIRFHF